MREKKTKILVGALLALVIFASSIALLMYSKHSELNRYIEAHIEVVIASRGLEKGDVITAADIQMSRLPKSYINYTPLTKAEIVGRYAKVKILASEPLRPEKLSLLKPEDDESIVVETLEVVEEVTQDLQSDTITIPLSIFQNVDNSLKKGDFIDIVSVYPSKSKNQEYKFSTKYIALHVPIDSFIHKSVVLDALSDIKYEDQNKISIADSVVLKITPNNIKNLLPMYYKTQDLNSKRVYGSKENRGHLWMVKAATEINEIVQKEKSKMLLNTAAPKVKHKRTLKRVKNLDKVSISYED
ncbi:hypothetical protein GJV85_07465 [Sulfurimonas aquatica]|uniref:SAF domain-containing protein n=1 Tax=Sulfurimonas aquatica TaxID=2672570 RepID=A0A975B0F6_9BACT|nr:SAF domain-containing protein [Sulfurimonas aquatica]QSZ41951.1 hypothetical protein GJV85_07465 [Sulfurimonas aquatica]